MTADLRSMLDVAEMTRHEGELLSTQDLDLDDIDDPHTAIAVWRAADRQAKAAAAVKKACGVRVAELLGEGGAAATGDIIVRYQRGKKETCIDPLAFTMFVTNEIVERRVKLDAVYTPSSAKKSWMDESVRDTFFEKVDDPTPKLVEIPRSKAPKFLRELEDGAVIIKEADHE